MNEFHSRVACLLLAASAFPLLRFARAGEVLPGTRPLAMQGDLSMENLKRVDRFLLRLVDQSVGDRDKLWRRDYSSPAAYVASVAPNRERLRRCIGAMDQRRPFEDLELVATISMASLVAQSEGLRIHAVRWPVFEGVDAEGLLLEPTQEARAYVVALPDADWTPERIAGVAGGGDTSAPLGRRLAEAGCRVLVPTLIDRDNTYSGNPLVSRSDQPHREFIYRQAFFLGRHVIGYEVAKVLAAVDFFAAENKRRSSGPLRIGVAGYGEGGLLALYSAAVDQRIDAVLVSGYFQAREGVWREPVYRNVWGLLHEFGDAGVASLVVPRSLVIEACRGVEVQGPPPQRYGRGDASSGMLTSPPLESVRAEVDRAGEHYRRLGLQARIRLVVSGRGDGPPGSDEALQALLSELGLTPLPTRWETTVLQDRRTRFHAAGRMERQFRQLVAHTQELMRLAPFRRAKFWSKADASSVDKWRATTPSCREYLWDEVIGCLPPPSMPPNARTRLVYDTPKWTGYEVVLDVWPDVFTYGMLLVPKGIAPGERRPVVVAQHGRGGTPEDVCTPDRDTRAYHSFGAKLADRGFVVYAPQNLYIGEEEYRLLQRKAFALKMTFFAPMVRQHEQVLAWVGQLPFVDARRIGFYGLSYGGKSAMLIPAVLEGYRLSICSGDFNETVWKHVRIDAGYSFALTKEHEHTEFDFGDKFNYSDLAGLIAPRPFMVERGHDDGVAPDEWVAYEYAKVRRLYAKLGIADRTEIEFFDGGHEIHAAATFDFLHKHLNWPKKQPL